MDSPEGGSRCITALHIPKRVHTHQIICLIKNAFQLQTTCTKQVPESSLCNQLAQALTVLTEPEGP